jgi:DNA-binding transcriptional LysR family regulator
MELRQLRYFVAVAEDLHFRRAAQRLHVAQPAVSEQIRKLEVELGVVLFDRTPRSVELTAAGSVLLEDARRILKAADSAAQSARATGQAVRKRLRLGSTAYGVPASMSAALGRMRVAGRPANVELACGDARSLLADVRAEQLDAAIVHLPGPTAGLKAISLGFHEAMVAVPRDSRLADGPLSLRDLRRQRLSVMPRSVDPAFHDAVIGSLVQGGLVADVVESPATSVEQLLLEVAAEGGAAIVPSVAAARCRLADVVVRSMPDGAPAVQLGLVTRQDAECAALAAVIAELRTTSSPARRATPAVAALAAA